MKMELNADNPFVQALAVSTAMALFMISVALGIMNMASNVAASSDTTPVPTAVILLIFAVVFIAGSVFFESRWKFRKFLQCRISPRVLVLIENKRLALLLGYMNRNDLLGKTA